jgi:MarR family transcriptional regulator, organic hydroperoxide resistance regulator
VDPLFEFALAVKAIQRELEQQANAVMRPLGLTAAQADALTVIGRAGPLSLGELGDLLIAESGHPSRLVDRLVGAGLVERRPADSDRRRVELSLTARGRRVERRAAEARERLFELAREAVGERDLSPALELLRELVRHTQFAELIARRGRLEAGAGRLDAGTGRPG